MKRRFTWGLALDEPRGAWLLCAGVLAVYGLTMQRGLGTFDSAELALAAHTLGLGHPPGQPLHTLVGFVFAHVPGVPALLGLNFLSALCGALCVLPMLSLAEHLQASDAVLRHAARPYVYSAVALGALHGALWEPATRIEVYPLATLCALWAVVLLVTRLDAALEDGAVAQRRLLFGAGVLFGLSASANPMIATLAALAVGLGLLGRLLTGRLAPSALLFAALGGMLGLTPYAYVFWAARRSDVFAWGRPIDAASARHYFSFADFAQNNRLAPGELVRHVFDWLLWCATQGSLPLVFVGVGVFAWLGRGRGLGPWLGLLSALGCTVFIASNVVWKVDNPDLLAYMGVPLALGVAAAGALVGRLSAQRRPALLLLAALALLTLLSPPSPLVRARHRDRFTDRLATTVLAGLPPGAILVSESDHLGAALLYLQLAEGRRPDVVHVAYGLGSSSWYWELLWRTHPELARVELRGAGGKSARLQRLFARNSERAVLFERSELAQQLAPGVLCVAGYLAGTGEYCASTHARSTVDPVPALMGALAELGGGSPGAAGLIALVAQELGLTRWHAGHTAGALAALRAGVAPEARPVLAQDAFTGLQRAAPPPLGWPRWQRAVLLGDPAHNLYLAAALLHGAAKPQLERAHLAAAAALGLPEARAALLPGM